MNPHHIEGFSLPQRLAERASVSALLCAAIVGSIIFATFAVAPWAAALWLVLE